MQAIKSRPELVHYDGFECLNCNTVIQAPPDGGAPPRRKPEPK